MMKSNEFKKPEDNLNEGPTWTAMKQFGKKLVGSPQGAVSTQDALARETFIKNFVSRALNSLNSSGVDKNLKTNFGAASAPPGPPPSSAPLVKTQTKLATQPLKPNTAVNFNTAPTNYSYKAMTGNAVPTTNIAAPAAKPTTANFGAPVKYGSTTVGTTKTKIKEDKFSKLNNLFESMLSEAVSVGEYLKRFANNYFKNVININDPEYVAELEKYALEVENTFGQRGSVTALQNLAAYAYSKAQEGQSTNMQNGNTSPSSTTGSTATTSPTNQIMVTLADMEPDQQKKILSFLQQLLSSQSSATPTPKVTESRLKKNTKI